MADFRDEIDELQGNNTKAELIDHFAEMVGKRTTSVNPVTQAMFDRIVPDHQPIEYARRDVGYSEDLKPVAKNATALKILLHEQVGRPLHDRVLTLKKRDFAECITAIDAYEAGHERGLNKHVPTTLPRSMDGFVSDIPDRTQTPTAPLDPILELQGNIEDQLTQWIEQDSTTTTADYFVYTLDCTPEYGADENPKVRDLRRAAKTQVEAGTSPTEFDPGKRAAHALNQNNRVYYVGSTNDLVKRVQEHVIGTAESGVDFTTTMSPKALVDVDTAHSRQEAETLESEQAAELDRHDGVFAYSDEL